MPYLLIAVPALLVLLAAYMLNEWAVWDDYRRLERKAHRNLERMAGR